MAIDIQLQTHESFKVLRFLSVVKYGNGIGYQCRLVVNSNGFSCDLPFFFGEFYLKKAIENLEKMDESFQGEMVLKEEYEESEIRLTMGSRGHVGVSGTIIGRSPYMQRLDFGFTTDQTVLRPFIADLYKLNSL
jgi:hypothetical protein